MYFVPIILNSPALNARSETVPNYRGYVRTVRDVITVPGKNFFLFFNIFWKFQLECSHTTKMSTCCKFPYNRRDNKVVGTNGLRPSYTGIPLAKKSYTVRYFFGEEPRAVRGVTLLGSVLKIRDILVRIRIRGSVPLIYETISYFFSRWLTRCQQRNMFFSRVFAYYFWRYIYISIPR